MRSNRIRIQDAHTHIVHIYLIDDFIQAMNRAHVERAVILSLPMAVIGTFNAIAAVAKHLCPKRLDWLAAVDYRDLDEPEFGLRAAARFERDVKELGAVGLKLLLGKPTHPVVTIEMTDDRVTPLYRKAAELGLPVLLHVADPQGNWDRKLWQVREAEGQPYADARYFPPKDALYSMLDQVLQAHRDTTFIVPHLMFLPERMSLVEEALGRHSNLSVDISAAFTYTAVKARGSEFRHLVKRFPERILFGTDWVLKVSLEGEAWITNSVHFNGSYRKLLEHDGQFTDVFDEVARGVALPQDILQKLYRDNARRIIPHSTKGPERHTLREAVGDLLTALKQAQVTSDPYMHSFNILGYNMLLRLRAAQEGGTAGLKTFVNRELYLDAEFLDNVRRYLAEHFGDGH